MQEIKEQLRIFRENYLDYITLECYSHSSVTEEIPACVISMANQFYPKYWNRLISVSLAGCGLELFPVCLKICECLYELNISRNSLRRLPSQLFVYYFPFLRILDVSDNLLTNLRDIYLLGQLGELEVLSAHGNNFSKAESRIELISSLLFSGIRPVTYFNKENNRMMVFMRIGNYQTVQNNRSFVEALKQLVKAAEFLKQHDIKELKPGKYESTQLTVDTVYLHDGSLFRLRGNVWFSGPGVTLIKDERIQAPFIVITTDEDAEIVGITPQIKYFIISEAGYYDHVLSSKTSAYVDSRAMKCGFFGERYFCYDMPLKTRQKQPNERYLSTVDLIKKSIVKDQRIISTANYAKLSKAYLDTRSMLPSEIQSRLRSELQETHFIANLNQRELYTQEMFPRLRILDGYLITISEYDYAQKSYNDARCNRILMLQAAYPLQQNVIRPMYFSQAYKPAENSSKITGYAAADLALESSAINTSKQLSEEIRKRQIYYRVIQQNKVEKAKAYKELKDFIQSGVFADDDGQHQLAMLLRAYDEETDPDIFTFVEQCKALQDEYLADRQARDTSARVDDGIVPNVLAEEQISMSQRYLSGYANSVTARLRDPEDAQALQLSNLESTREASTANKRDDEEEVMLALSRNTKSAEPGRRSPNTHTQSETLQYSYAARKATAQDRVYKIEMALMQSQIAYEDVGVHAYKPAYLSQLSYLIPASLTQTSNLDYMRPHLYHCNPLRHVQNSTGIYAYAAEYQAGDCVSSSQITKPMPIGADVTKQPLPLESGHISFEDMKTVPDEVQSAAAGINGVYENKLLPSFDELLKYELQSQHAATNELLMHVSANIDPAVRRQLATPQINVSVRDDPASEIMTKRHPAILDVVAEGDKLRAAPNKIMDSANRAKLTSYTTEEAMYRIDSTIMRQNITYELEKQNQGGQSTIKAMLKQNNEDIANYEMHEKRNEHIRRLSLIKSEKPMPYYYVKPSGQEILLAKYQRKVYQIERRNALLTSRRQTIIGYHQQFKKYQKGQVSDVLNIETVEDAVEHAKLINIGASELIDAGNHIMANAQQQINELHEYGYEFVRKEIQWDEMYGDTLYKLMRGKEALCQDRIYKSEPPQEIPLSEESKRFSIALARGKDTRSIFKPLLREAQELTVSIIGSNNPQ